MAFAFRDMAVEIGGCRRGADRPRINSRDIHNQLISNSRSTQISKVGIAVNQADLRRHVEAAEPAQGLPLQQRHRLSLEPKLLEKSSDLRYRNRDSWHTFERANGERNSGGVGNGEENARIS